jgi:hypothetical protein
MSTVARTPDPEMQPSTASCDSAYRAFRNCFLCGLLLINGALFLSAQEAGGWGVIGIAYVFAPAANIAAMMIGLIASLIIKVSDSPPSIMRFVVMSLLLPLVAMAGLFVAIMMFVDAHGC